MIDSGFRLVKTDRYDKGEGPIIRSEFFRDRDQSFLFISMSSTSSTTTAAAAAPSNIVDINSLSIEELSSLQQQLNAELNFLQRIVGRIAECFQQIWTLPSNIGVYKSAREEQVDTHTTF